MLREKVGRAEEEEHLLLALDRNDDVAQVELIHWRRWSQSKNDRPWTNHRWSRLSDELQVSTSVVGYSKKKSVLDRRRRWWSWWGMLCLAKKRYTRCSKFPTPQPYWLSIFAISHNWIFDTEVAKHKFLIEFTLANQWSQPLEPLTSPLRGQPPWLVLLLCAQPTPYDPWANPYYTTCDKVTYLDRRPSIEIVNTSILVDSNPTKKNL